MAVMRRPDKTQLESTMVVFLVLAPMIYFTIRGLVALLG
jgi:hypothetical protein